ncbi:MAG TPA: phosphoenolpyruvate carboxylase [Kofleriaceae bacterium]|nr:phosphoenolpyruvate carboxylase [Kofleriaceae bacterium]
MSSSLLHRDVTRLTEALAASVTQLGGEAANAMCQRLGLAAGELRRGTLTRAAFRAQIAELDEPALEDLARAFSLHCHLMNIAEERERLRALRLRGEHPPDGLAAAVDALIDRGASAEDVRGLFDRALVMPVLTAHPTEARRRSTLDHLTRIEQLLDELDTTSRTRVGRTLAADVLAFHATEDARARRPTPLDEVENSLEVFRRSLLDVTPRIYRTIEDRLATRLGGDWRLPAFLRWGTWVGGDRDGNPNVTASVTRTAFARHRAAVVARYLDDMVVLGRSLSASVLRAHGGTEELEASIARDRELLPEVAARARARTIHEPWREKLWYVQARLRATLDHRDEGYVGAADYRADLAVIDRSLRAAGLAPVAEQDLRDALRRIDVFGFHLSSLDVRQHSAVHDRVVAELLARGGRPGYLDRDEAGRRAWLAEVLAAPLSPERDRAALSPDVQEVLATLEVIGRARRELGPAACERYVISFTRDASDLLEVAFLARAAGLAPGELRPVPLLEQLEDLERAGQIARDVLALPALRTELGNELEVMIGYSDSGKQVGYVAAAVALRHAQIALVDATRDASVMLTLFHGRGGALGRGGGPESDAIRAQPAAALRGRLRVTEQGETVTARYAHPEIAERDLELTLAAILDATVAGQELDPADDAAAGSSSAAISTTDVSTALALQRAASAARDRYYELTRDEDRLVRYTVAATPIEDVAHLPLGSRPASRKSGIALDSLRAIPWVFSWTQSRHGIPGWFGMGTALETLAAELGPIRLRSLADESRFLRALVTNCELSLVRSDIAVAGEYAELADRDAQRIYDLIAAEHARTVTALRDLLGRTALLANRPYLAASVARRNAYLDVLSHVQIEALRRRRASTGDVDRLSRIVFTTIGGIAAGLQTAG